MGEWKEGMRELLGPFSKLGLRPEIGLDRDGTLQVTIHGFDELKEKAGEAVRLAQRVFGVPKIERSVSGGLAWWKGTNDGVGLTLFRYLGPRCFVETYTVTEPAKPARTVPAEPVRFVTKTRIVCDDQSEQVVQDA